MATEIYKSVTISTGHRVVGHLGKCKNLHGHNYLIEVTLRAIELSDEGFVVDYGEIKRLIMRWDHKMLLWDEDPIHVRDREGLLRDPEEGIVRVPFNPTAENMADHLAAQFYAMERVTYAQVTVHESDSSYAEASYGA